jgi:hypothetical protein
MLLGTPWSSWHTQLLAGGASQNLVVTMWSVLPHTRYVACSKVDVRYFWANQSLFCDWHRQEPLYKARAFLTRARFPAQPRIALEQLLFLDLCLDEQVVSMHERLGPAEL